MMSYILAKVSNPDKGQSGFTDRSKDIEAFLNQKRADKAARMQKAKDEAALKSSNNQASK